MLHEEANDNGFGGVHADSVTIGMCQSAEGPVVAMTEPVDHEMETLGSDLKLVGLRLHHSMLFGGVIQSVGSDFVEIAPQQGQSLGEQMEKMQAGVTYILEIRGGAQEGAIQEVVRWEGARLFTPEDLGKAGVKEGDAIAVRAAATLASVFGTHSSPLRKGKNSLEADWVVVPDGLNMFGRICYLHESGMWVDGDGKNANHLPLIYPDAVIVRTGQLHPVRLQMAGEVRSGPVRSVIQKGFNLVELPSAASRGLQSLGLEEDLVPGDGISEGDEVWLEHPAGDHFESYHVGTDGKWRKRGEDEPLEEPVSLGSAILILRRGDADLPEGVKKGGTPAFGRMHCFAGDRRR